MSVVEVSMGTGTKEVGVSVSGVILRTIETGRWRRECQALVLVLAVSNCLLGGAEAADDIVDATSSRLV